MGTDGARDVIHRAADDRRWRGTRNAGVEVCGLRDNGAGGGSILVRVAAGSRVPMHEHPGGEEVLIVQGRAVVDGITLRPGDYLWTGPGIAHDLRAEEDTLLFVSTPQGVRLVE